MDCQTFWRSNPKRLKQFCEARNYGADIDLQAWATGAYVGLAFAGKLPEEPNLIKVAAEEPEELTPQQEIARLMAWAADVNANFRAKHKEVPQDG